jgi:hypothetical protein
LNGDSIPIGRDCLNDAEFPVYNTDRIDLGQTLERFMQDIYDRYIRRMGVREMVILIVVALLILITAAVIINPGGSEEVDFTITPTSLIRSTRESTGGRSVISPPAPTPTRP